MPSIEMSPAMQSFSKSEFSIIHSNLQNGEILRRYCEARQADQQRRIEELLKTEGLTSQDITEGRIIEGKRMIPVLVVGTPTWTNLNYTIQWVYPNSPVSSEPDDRNTDFVGL